LAIKNLKNEKLEKEKNKTGLKMLRWLDIKNNRDKRIKVKKKMQSTSTAPNTKSSQL
jgi:hypothetical protein